MKIALALLLGMGTVLCYSVSWAGNGRVVFTIVDAGAGGAVPCRLHVFDRNGKPRRADGVPFFRDHMTVPGSVKLSLPRGKYTYLAARGPEYSQARGAFEIEEDETRSLTLKVGRLHDMPSEGWWAGDLHVHRPLEEIELLMRAEDLHVAPVITWWNKRNVWKDKTIPENKLVRFDGDRFYHVMGGEDERNGGALLYFHLQKPMDIAWAEKMYPSGLQFFEEARKTKGVWVDIEKPFWWDVPVWLAHGAGDSVGLANNHMYRAGMYENEAWGRPRDAERLPPPRGNGFWSQEIYYHILNSGIRIPPSAGSASGVLPNPLGYDRVYVHVGAKLTWDGWWEGLRAGRCFVTNGPLLRTRANGKLPGFVFSEPSGKSLTIEVKADLDGEDIVPKLEIVKNGKIAKSVSVKGRRGTIDLGTVRFEESGWFLVRALAENEKTFRFASTGPYYVEIGDKKSTVRRDSVLFFLKWLEERESQLDIPNPGRRTELLRYHKEAVRFWENKL